MTPKELEEKVTRYKLALQVVMQANGGNVGAALNDLTDTIEGITARIPDLSLEDFICASGLLYIQAVQTLAGDKT